MSQTDNYCVSFCAAKILAELLELNGGLVIE